MKKTIEPIGGAVEKRPARRVGQVASAPAPRKTSYTRKVDANSLADKFTRVPANKPEATQPKAPKPKAAPAATLLMPAPAPVARKVVEPITMRLPRPAAPAPAPAPVVSSAMNPGLKMRLERAVATLAGRLGRSDAHDKRQARQLLNMNKEKLHLIKGADAALDAAEVDFSDASLEI